MQGRVIAPKYGACELICHILRLRAYLPHFEWQVVCTSNFSYVTTFVTKANTPQQTYLSQKLVNFYHLHKPIEMWHKNYSCRLEHTDLQFWTPSSNARLTKKKITETFNVDRWKQDFSAALCKMTSRKIYSNAPDSNDYIRVHLYKFTTTFVLVCAFSGLLESDGLFEINLTGCVDNITKFSSSPEQT